jgi:crotonobetainyl-CoA:carnitine CoA-transferase CaiB-like acyl-CoA transferase
MIGELFASVPGQRPVKFTGQSLRLFDQRRNDAFSILVCDLDQHHVARIEQRAGIDIESIMDANSVPCSRFLTVAGAMKDPQLAERGSLAEINDGAGQFLVPNAPFQFSTPTMAGSAVSGLGADGREVLSGLLGLSEEQINGLYRQGILSGGSGQPD